MPAEHIKDFGRDFGYVGSVHGHLRHAPCTVPSNFWTEESPRRETHVGQQTRHACVPRMSPGSGDQANHQTHAKQQVNGLSWPPFRDRRSGTAPSSNSQSHEK